MGIAARAEKLTKRYTSGSVHLDALIDVDFDVHDGEFIAIMGPSGSGKSTLMYLLAGLVTPTEGEVFIGHSTIASLSDTALTKLRRERIGFVFQTFNLVPTLTAYENIILPSTIAGTAVDEDWLDQLIDVLDLEDCLPYKPNHLSGGQQQRIVCARALINRPAIVFADELTGNLDSSEAAEIIAFLRHSVDEFRQSIVMVTHDALSASYADRVVFLSAGRIVDQLSNPTTAVIVQTMAQLYSPTSLKTKTTHITPDTASTHCATPRRQADPDPTVDVAPAVTVSLPPSPARGLDISVSISPPDTEMTTTISPLTTSSAALSPASPESFRHFANAAHHDPIPMKDSGSTRLTTAPARALLDDGDVPQRARHAYSD